MCTLLKCRCWLAGRLREARAARCAGGQWPGVCAGLLWLTLCAAAQADGSVARYVTLPSGTLASVLANDAEGALAVVDAFSMRVTPVTQGEFRGFLQVHPEWVPGRVPHTFSDAGYLAGWPKDGGDAAPTGAGNVRDSAWDHRPVTNVSWFAAQAFCEAEGARLPTWLEWEYSAAADATRTDARTDPVWLAHILGWYGHPANTPLAAVGGPANVYGVRDMHGLIWEWVDDFNALLVSPDSRAQQDGDKLKFCGAGAIDLKDKQNYAVLMRIALLSSLNAADSTSSLGFRCVRPL